MVNTVIFDMDGLMFDTETISTDGFIYAAKKQGYDMTEEETFLVLGYNRDGIYNFYDEYFKNRRGKEGNLIDGRKIVDDQFDYLERVLFTTGPSKMPYLVELLEYLRKNGYKIVVASGSDRRDIVNNIEKNQVQDYIDHIVSGQDVKNSKPDPEIFMMAADKVNARPEECLVLEDSRNGVEAGYRAGMRVIMVPDKYQPDKETRDRAYKVVEDLGCVIEILDK